MSERLDQISHVASPERSRSGAVPGYESGVAEEGAHGAVQSGDRCAAIREGRRQAGRVSPPRSRGLGASARQQAKRDSRSARGAVFSPAPLMHPRARPACSALVGLMEVTYSNIRTCMVRPRGFEPPTFGSGGMWSGKAGGHFRPPLVCFQSVAPTGDNPKRRRAASDCL